MEPLQRCIAQEIATDDLGDPPPRREALRRLALLGLGTASATALIATADKASAADVYGKMHVDVTDHGAVGDGKTLNDGAFAAAFAEAKTTSLPIYIPPGDFCISRTLDWRHNGLRVQGDMSESIIRQMTDNVPIMQVAGRYLMLDGFRLFYNNAQPVENTDAKALTIQNLVSSQFRNIIMERGYAGIWGLQESWKDGGFDSIWSAYSCQFDNIRTQRMTGNHHYYAGANTGNLWDNIYITNMLGYVDPETGYDVGRSISGMHITHNSEFTMRQINIEHGFYSSALHIDTAWGGLIDSVHVERFHTVEDQQLFYFNRSNCMVRGVYLIDTQVLSNWSLIRIVVTSQIEITNLREWRCRVTGTPQIRRLTTGSTSNESVVRFRNWSLNDLVLTNGDYVYPGTQTTAPVVVQDERRLIQPVLGAASNIPVDATTGFAYLPKLAGVPTGVPVAESGGIPVAVDNSGQMWTYNIAGEDWKADLSGEAILDFPSVGPRTHQELSITIPGVPFSPRPVAVGVPATAALPGLVYTAWVSNTDIVTVRACNYTDAAIEPAAGSFQVTVMR